MSIQRLNPDALLKFPPLSQVVVFPKSSRIVHVAGQSACNENFVMIGGNDYRAQSLQALRNLRTAVEAAGGSVDNICSSTVFIKNLTPDAGAAFLDALATADDGQPFPPHAFSIIGVQALAAPDALVEISAVAALDH